MTGRESGGDGGAAGFSGSAGTAQAKKEALEKVGVRVGRTPSETAGLVRELRPGAVGRLSTAMGWDPAPWCPRIF